MNQYSNPVSVQETIDEKPEVIPSRSASGGRIPINAIKRHIAYQKARTGDKVVLTRQLRRSLSRKKAPETIAERAKKEAALVVANATDKPPPRQVRRSRANGSEARQLYQVWAAKTLAQQVSDGRPEELERYLARLRFLLPRVKGSSPVLSEVVELRSIVGILLRCQTMAARAPEVMEANGYFLANPTAIQPQRISTPVRPNKLPRSERKAQARKMARAEASIEAAGLVIVEPGFDSHKVPRSARHLSPGYAAPVVSQGISRGGKYKSDHGDKEAVEVEIRLDLSDGTSIKCEPMQYDGPTATDFVNAVNSLTPEDTKKAEVIAALEAAGGVKTRAAEALGISPRTLRRWMEEMEISQG